ncbi:hypothetical protein FRC18_006348 [Serendipita sp. 400]|nr:hypothetical protein FRC18_006348 [Serendipita sp. 400]
MSSPSSFEIISPYTVVELPRRHSDEFSSNYGSFRLISSDFVVFHFPKWLLAYISPVFGDMFALGDSMRDNDCQEVTLQEDSTSLDLLLRFIDPKKANPRLDLDVTPGLLEAGRKYQIDTLSDWVYGWLCDAISVADDRCESFGTSQMAQILEIGTTYDFPHLSRLALRRLIKAPSKELIESNVSRSKLYDHLMRLRTGRIEWFREQIGKILHGGAPIRLLKDHTFLLNDMKYAEIMQTVVKLSFEIASEPSLACVDRYWPTKLYDEYIHGSKEKMASLRKAALCLEFELPELPNTSGHLLAS